MTRFIFRVPALLFLLVLPVCAQNNQKDKIDRMASQVEEMKTELTLLQRQIQGMQDTFNKSSGEMNTLITQISDNISAVRRAQSSVSTNSNDAATQLSAMSERVSASDQRIERLSEQFAQLRKLIEDIPKQPTIAHITPGNAEQLFAAAYSDYSRANYDLALSEFRQYVETYPTSELADNAQYWIGEILYAQKKLPEAAAEFERVQTVNPKGDKVASRNVQARPGVEGDGTRRRGCHSVPGTGPRLPQECRGRSGVATDGGPSHSRPKRSRFSTAPTEALSHKTTQKTQRKFPFVAFVPFCG